MIKTDPLQRSQPRRESVAPDLSVCSGIVPVVERLSATLSLARHRTLVGTQHEGASAPSLA